MKFLASSCQYIWTLILALAFTNPGTSPAEPGQSGIIMCLELVLVPPPRVFLKVLWFCSFRKTKIYKFQLDSSFLSLSRETSTFPNSYLIKIKDSGGNQLQLKWLSSRNMSTMLILSVISIISVFTSTDSGWKAQYERTRDHCIHGLGCKTGPSCKSKSCPVLAFSVSRNARERLGGFLSPDVA